MKSSEGAAYNVVSNLPKDSDRMRAVEEKQMRTTLVRVRGAVEHHAAEVAQAALEKSEFKGVRAHFTAVYVL